MASYPGAVKTFTTKNSGDAIQPAHIDDLQDEVNAIEAGLLQGTANLNSSNSTLANLSVPGGSTLATLQVTGNSTFGSTMTIGGVPYQWPSAVPASSGQTLVVASTGTPNVLKWASQAYTSTWTTPVFSSGVFFGSGGGSWSVDSGDVTTFAYLLNGKTMTVSFELLTTSCSSTPTLLNITVPVSSTIAKNMSNRLGRLVDNGTLTDGYAKVTAGQTVIQISRADNNSFANAANTTDVRGQITFEIQ